LQGFAKFYRFDGFENLIKNHPRACLLLTYLIYETPHFKRHITFNGIRMTVEPNQIITSSRTLSADLKIPRTSIRRSLKYLEKIGKLEKVDLS